MDALFVKPHHLLSWPQIQIGKFSRLEHYLKHLGQPASTTPSPSVIFPVTYYLCIPSNSNPHPHIRDFFFFLSSPHTRLEVVQPELNALLGICIQWCLSCRFLCVVVETGPRCERSFLDLTLGTIYSDQVIHQLVHLWDVGRNQSSGGNSQAGPNSMQTAPEFRIEPGSLEMWGNNSTRNTIPPHASGTKVLSAFLCMWDENRQRREW